MEIEEGDNKVVELNKFDLCEVTSIGEEKGKYLRRTSEAKGCYFLAGFLQVSKMFLKHFLKVSKKSSRSV